MSVVPLPASAAELPGPTIGTQYVLGSDGTTDPIYDFADAVIEHVYVQTKMDSDLDGRLDLVRADIIRPQTGAGEKVPSIITASGYYGTPDLKPYVDEANNDTSDLAYMPDFYDNYFVPRGYAYLSVDVAGTNWSEGCVDDVGPNDVESVAAVVRWLSGAVGSVAYRNLDRVESVDANAWSSGHSAVTGISYDGGIANAVAASTDVPGLETVVPIAGGSSGYNTRPNGVYVGGGTADFSEWLTDPEPASVKNPTLPAKLRAHQALKRIQCQPSFDAMRADSDPDERTYNRFWIDRNVTDKVDQIAANGVSVFLATGQGDMIVRTNEMDKHWAALQRAGVTSKLWLHLRAHIDPFDADQDAWMSQLHRWFDHELVGVPNGVTDEPAARVEITPDVWVESSTWPVAGSAARTLHLGGATQKKVGTLGTSAQPVASVAAFEGGQLVDAAPFALTDGSSTPAAGEDRLVYVSAPFERDSRISGTPSVKLHVKASEGDSNVSVALVDYGPGTYVDWSTTDGVKNLATKRQWGFPNAFEKVTFPDTAALTLDKGSYVFSRGTANTAHYQSLSAYTPAPTDSFVDLTWDLYATDHIVPAGHRLGVVLYNNTIQLDPSTIDDYVGTSGSDIDEAASTIVVPMTVLPRLDWAPANPGPVSPSPTATAAPSPAPSGQNTPAAAKPKPSSSSATTHRALAATGLSTDAAGPVVAGGMLLVLGICLALWRAAARRREGRRS